MGQEREDYGERRSPGDGTAFIPIGLLVPSVLIALALVCFWLVTHWAR